MLKLSKSDYDKILAYAVAALPNEACGLIAGELSDGNKIIKKAYLLTNTDFSDEHFSADPKEQLASVRDMRENGIIPLGNWHSHPNSPPIPSDEDIRLAYDNDASYLILSLEDSKNPVLNSFKIDGTNVQKEKLVIE